MIENIQITNFKSIKHLDLKLNDINVLIGANGVGKSNFLSFFEFLKSLIEGINSVSLKRYIARNGYMSNVIFYGLKDNDGLKGNVKFSRIDKYGAFEYSFSLISDSNGMPSGEKIIDSNESSNNSDFINVSNSPNGTAKLIRRLMKIYHFHDTSFESPLRKLSRIDDNARFRENGENLPAFLYYLQEKHPKRLRRIERVITSVAPFFDSFNLKPDRINEEFIQLEWKEKGFDRYQNAQNLSDGTLRFIALTTLLLQPNPPKTIIIDEPELGLHPSAINKLAGLIRKVSAHSQIILSTQSVNLVNNFEPEDIITVDRKNHQSVFNRLNSNSLSIWLEDYGIGDLWSKSVIGGQP